jgi:hypothetical protein
VAARLTEWVNDAPGWTADGLWPVMQLGTLTLAVVAATVVGIVRRDWFLAGAMIVAGTFTWFAAKILKDIVERKRPPAYIPGIDIREGTGAGLGFLGPLGRRRGHGRDGDGSRPATRTGLARLARVAGGHRPDRARRAPAGGRHRRLGVRDAVGVVGLTLVDRYRSRHPLR